MKTIKTFAVLSLIGIAVLSAFSIPTTTKRSEEMKAKKTKMEIRNNHEWDQLEETVVGSWQGEVFKLNEGVEDFRDVYPYLSESGNELLLKTTKVPMSKADPDTNQRWVDETEKLAEVLEGLGVKVRRPDVLNTNPDETVTIYSRDPIISIGNKFLLTNLKSLGRRVEGAGYKRIALDLARKYDGEVIMMPENRPGMHEDNAYLEGGDVFVNGNEIYVGMTGNATNMNGVEWLRETLGADYTVYVIPLNNDVLHLDCAFTLLSPNQGIICKEDFKDPENLPGKLANYEWVEVTPEEAKAMATNGVVVNSKTLIAIDAFPHVAQEIRDRFGIKVIEMPYEKAVIGGGMRCSYQPILRK